MKAKSIKGKSQEEIRTALQQSMEDGFKPTLAIVFISVEQDRKAFCEYLQHKGLDVFGATSSGEFIEDHESDGGIAVLLLELNRDLYTVLFEEIGNKTLRELSDDLAKASQQKFSNPSLILCTTGLQPNGEFFDGETMVRSLESALGPDRIFFGGMAGDDMQFKVTHVFNHDRDTNHGIIALVLNADKVALRGMAITGWQTMGISRKVTKSSGKLLYTIDDKPAVAMYLKYLGHGEKSGEKGFDFMDELAYDYPFITKRDEIGEILIKSPMRIDHDENALVMDIEMLEGDEFWFSMPPDFNIAQEIINEAAYEKHALASDSDALLIFSCAGRRPVLGPLVTVENNGLADVWKTPMAGFFTYGEYGRAKNGRQHFHTGACCWVALKEK